MLALAVSLIAAGCGSASSEDLAKEVRAEIIKKFASDPETAGIKVGELALVHRGGNDYRGILEVTAEGESEQLSVEVTYDGETILWQIEAQ
jgi:hypothetical protein